MVPQIADLLRSALPNRGQSRAKGAATTATAAFEGAPGPIDGEFIWSCESAEFYEDGSWVPKEVRLSQGTAQVRFRRPGYFIGCSSLEPLAL